MANEILLEEYDVGDITETWTLEEYSDGVIEVKLDLGERPMHAFKTFSDNSRIRPAVNAIRRYMEKAGWVDDEGETLVSDLNLGDKTIHRNGRFYFLMRAYRGEEKEDPFYQDAFHSERIVH